MSLTTGAERQYLKLRPADPLLSVDGLTVRFGGVVANNDVALWCREGSITALLGPNGAGKTTCFNVISGAQRAKAGSVRFAGRDVTHSPPHIRAQLGMARTFQNLAVVNDMSVLDNVRIGAGRFGRYGFGSAILGLPSVRRRDRQLADIAYRALQAVGLTELADVAAQNLPYGDLRRLELARALALGPRLLLLDEPAAGLDTAESHELGAALRRMRDEWGISIFMVEHDLELVRAVAEEAFVLDFGVILGGGDIRTVLEDPAVVEAYLGKAKGHVAVMEEAMSDWQGVTGA